VNEKITIVSSCLFVQKNAKIKLKKKVKKKEENLLKCSGSRHVKGPALLLALITY
jgi:hypothetical protein